MRRISALCLILAILSCGTKIYAHPHIIVDYVLLLNLSKNGLEFLDIQWFFNEEYSRQLIDEFDQNRDGQFQIDEANLMYKNAFSNAAEVGFFLQCSIDDQLFSPTKTEGFLAEIDGNRVIFNFKIPCHISRAKDTRFIELVLLDENNFVSFDLWYFDDLTEGFLDYKIQFVMDSSHISHRSPLGIRRMMLEFPGCPQGNADVFFAKNDTVLKLVSGEPLRAKDSMENPLLDTEFKFERSTQLGNPFISH